VPAREKYQQMARRCLRAAERLHDPVERQKLLEVAGGTWRWRATSPTVTTTALPTAAATTIPLATGATPDEATLGYCHSGAPRSHSRRFASALFNTKERPPEAAYKVGPA
jgi:glutamate/tyrosine decarboxylase-like PLP-dependent enzyme